MSINISASARKVLCEDFSSVFAQTLDENDIDSIYKSDSFSKIRTEVQKSNPRISDSEILKEILEEYSRVLHTT